MRTTKPRTLLRRLALACVALATLFLGTALVLASCVFAAPVYRGAPTEHFDGARFHDHKPSRGSGAAFLRWQWERKPGAWPEWIESAPGSPPPKRVDEPGRLRVTFVNHATTLVQLDSVNILTDPIWSERASPLSFVGPKRVRAPGLRFEDLPPIDVVVLSHNHYDHMDIATLKRLRDAHHPIFLAGLGNDAFLAGEGIEAKPLEWFDVVDVHGVKIHSVPNQHFSGRGISDNDGNLWTAYLFEGPTAGRVYFAGDTGYGAHFAETGAKFPGIRAALLPIGAYKPEWFMGPVHTTPAEAVRAQHDLGARVAVAIHWGTFPLADDGYDEPLRDLTRALDDVEKATGKRPAFWALDFGEGRDVP